MKFAHAVGWFNTRLLLTVVYIVVIAVPALLLRLFRRDPLNRRFDRGAQSYWTDRQGSDNPAGQAKHQF
jgi:hypothetical protein